MPHHLTRRLARRLARLGGQAAIASLLAGAAWPGAAWEPNGTQRITAHLADGQQAVLGTVTFTPAAASTAAFRVTMRTEAFSDHFLSMREFKCLEGARELSCHVPFPYPNPGTLGPGDYAWLEHSLLFFYKAPADFGAKLWNGLYFEFRPTDTGLVGLPKAVDLNLIAAPARDPSKAPLRPALRHDIPADARWIRRLVIE
jgi:hypothetical protein